ncbi:MAG: efflux RND transporter permease subunit [Roseiflexaceae bacterium]|nr:efflux RND transporter permease subunit [Roseiflexaceae bacterium]
MARKRINEPLHGMAVSDVSIKQPVFVVMVMLLAVVVGLFAYTRLPVSLLPDFSVPVVSIVTNYPGAGPESVAQQVSEPIEGAVTTLSGIRNLTSTSSEGISVVVIEFNSQVNINQALQEAREAVNRIRPLFPRAVKDPSVEQYNPSAAPILQVAVAANQSLSPLELRRLIDREFIPALRRVDGVGAVAVAGGRQRQINVLLRLDRLQVLAISPAQISAAINGANLNAGLGALDIGSERLTIRAPNLLQSVDDIAQLPIGGTPYRVGDVATIEDGIAEVATYARLNGQDAVTLSVVKRAGANTITVARDATDQLERLIAANPQLTLVVTADDAREVRAQVSSSIEEMVLAVIAALLVVLLFFRDLPNTLVTMAGLPIILIATFGAMLLFGLSLNILTLLALSLSVGLVIDDAIVVRENIFRYMERGFTPVQAASRATAEVALSVLAMTLTIIAVFLPVTFTTGTTGIIFKAFGITVAAAMALSLVEAFTFAPMLSAHLFHGRNKPIEAASDTAPPSAGATGAQIGHDEPDWLGRQYARALRWSLRRRWVPVAAALVILLVSGIVASSLQFAFLPAGKSSTVTISYEAPVGSNLATTDALARQAEAVIQADPEVVAVQVAVGGDGYESGSNSGAFTVLAASADASEAVRDRLRPQLAFLPKLAFSTVQADGTTSTGIAARAIQVQVRSSRPPAELAPIVARVEETLGAIPGTADIGTNLSSGQPELQLAFDPARIAALGLGAEEIQAAISALIGGETATTLRQSGQDTNIVVRLAPDQRADLAALQNLSLPTPSGVVLLGEIARIERGAGPASIRRANRLYEIVVGANVAEGSDEAVVRAAVQAAVGEIERPADVTLGFGGQQRDQDEGLNSLFIAMGLSVLFVYMVLASQFGSFLQPLVIMLAMPFSFIGAFVALRLANLPLDIVAMIGLIMLLGLVVKNSILLVDFANQLRDTGVEKHAALVQAGAVRLRPILMTSAAIVAGAVPTAFGIHFFSEGGGLDLRRGIAVVLIGGMLTSTLLTLLIVPTAYSLLDSFTARIATWRSPRARPVNPAVPAQTADDQPISRGAS